MISVEIHCEVGKCTIEMASHYCLFCVFVSNLSRCSERRNDRNIITSALWYMKKYLVGSTTDSSGDGIMYLL